MIKRSKRYINGKKLIDATKLYSVEDAVKLANETANTKFNGSINLVIKLNLDTTKAEQQLRGNIALPHYFGKKTRILILDDNLSKTAAEAEGIDFFGGNELITRIKEG
jgi:large subunit ribosomal protein L1